MALQSIQCLPRMSSAHVSLWYAVVSLSNLQHKYPDLDPVNVKQQLDDLAAEVEAGLPAGSRYPLRVMKEINRVLYQVWCGLSGWLVRLTLNTHEKQSWGS